MEDAFLTAKQVQELLNVDRTTIYRMLKDGRLKGIKVGKHWRFSERIVHDLISQEKPNLLVAANRKDIVFPFPCMQTVQDVFAEVAEVGALTADPNGQPMTEISNACEFCKLILDSQDGRRSCMASWKYMAEQRYASPSFIRCHAGLMYACAYINLNESLVAILVAGQFYTEMPDPEEALERYTRLAKTYQIDLDQLRTAAEKISVLDYRRISKIGGWLEKVALSFRQIGVERGALISRLRKIADMSLLET